MAVQGKKPSKLPWWCWLILLGIVAAYFVNQPSACPEGGCKPPPPSVPTDVGTLKPRP